MTQLVMVEGTPTEFEDPIYVAKEAGHLMTTSRLAFWSWKSTGEEIS
jgi:hypothetical protein